MGVVVFIYEQFDDCVQFVLYYSNKDLAVKSITSYGFSLNEASGYFTNAEYSLTAHLKDVSDIKDLFK